MTHISLSLTMRLNSLRTTVMIKMITTLLQIRVNLILIEKITKSGKSASLDMNGTGSHQIS